MPALVVPRQQTPLGMVEVTARLAATFEAIWGRMPSLPLLRIASGIVGFENAGGWAIWNGNVGNVTAPAGFDGRVWEANGLQFIDFGDTKDATLEGAKYWWRFMAALYHDVLVSADMGELGAAVRDLFRRGYVGSHATAEQLSDYTRGVAKWAAESELPARTIVDYFRKPWIGAAIGGSALVAVGAGGYYWHTKRRAVA